MITVEPPVKNIEGVTQEAAKMVQKALESGRRYFGSSAASLTHQVFNPEVINSGIKPELAKVGMEGERDTTRFLKKWIADKPNAVLIDSVHVRGWGKEEIDEETGFIDGGDTDHVIVIGNEVILIDTKRWKSKKNYTVSENGEALRTNQTFGGGKLNMKSALYLWLNFLHDSASLTGIVCINSEDIVVFRNRNWYTQSFRLVELARFEELLNEKWKMISDRDKNRINTTLVSQIAVNAVKPFDSYSRVFDMNSLRDFK